MRFRLRPRAKQSIVSGAFATNLLQLSNGMFLGHYGALGVWLFVPWVRWVDKHRDYVGRIRGFAQ